MVKNFNKFEEATSRVLDKDSAKLVTFSEKKAYNFNKFESASKDVLNEDWAETLQKAGKGLAKLTGIEALDRPGFVTNAYSIDKRYYLPTGPFIKLVAKDRSRAIKEFQTYCDKLIIPELNKNSGTIDMNITQIASNLGIAEENIAFYTGQFITDPNQMSQTEYTSKLDEFGKNKNTIDEEIKNLVYKKKDIESGKINFNDLARTAVPLTRNSVLHELEKAYRGLVGKLHSPQQQRHDAPGSFPEIFGVTTYAGNTPVAPVLTAITDKIDEIKNKQSLVQDDADRYILVAEIMAKIIEFYSDPKNLPPASLYTTVDKNAIDAHVKLLSDILIRYNKQIEDIKDLKTNPQKAIDKIDQEIREAEAESRDLVVSINQFTNGVKVAAQVTCPHPGKATHLDERKLDKSKMFTTGSEQIKSTTDTAKPGLIIINNWNDFVEKIKKSITASSTRYNIGVSLDEILAGKVWGYSKYRRERSLESDSDKTLNQSSIEDVHKNIMLPVFLKPGKLAYMTDEQYKSKSEGLLSKAAGAAGGALKSIGQAIPTAKV